MAKSLNKNYLLITPSISNLGGAQLYILRRAKYLICQGFSVKVIISHHNGDNFILKDQFLEIPTLFLNQLRNPISFYSKKKIDLIVSTILDFVKGYNGGIIESSSLETAI